MAATKLSQSYFRCVKLFIHEILCSYQVYRWKSSRLSIVKLCIYHFCHYTIYCSSDCEKPLENNIFGFSVVFSHKHVQKFVQILIFKVEYLGNGFNDFGIILQEFERPSGWNQLVLALQFRFLGEFFKRDIQKSVAFLPVVKTS